MGRFGLVGIVSNGISISSHMFNVSDLEGSAHQ